MTDFEPTPEQMIAQAGLRKAVEEDGIMALPDTAIAAHDPADPAVVIETDPPQPITVITSHEGWTMERVYSQYTSREVFIDPQGVNWVRVSSANYNPARGDIEIELKTRGLSRMLLRRRDALAANLKKEA